MFVRYLSLCGRDSCVVRVAWHATTRQATRHDPDTTRIEASRWELLGDIADDLFALRAYLVSVLNVIEVTMPERT